MVTLSARSPYNMMSGCTIQRRMTEGIPPPAYPPTDDITTTNPAYFDQFLKTTTTSTVSPVSTTTDLMTDYELLNGNFSGFNESDVFNVSAFFDISSVGRHPIVFQHDTAFENDLENSTDFRQDVEELFEPPATGGIEDLAKQQVASKDDARIRRNSPAHLFPPTREAIRVKCHNAGRFFSSRERWWYIAIANCGSEKGLDVTYRFKMTNGDTGDFWHEHFSADEMCKLSMSELMVPVRDEAFN